MSVFNTDERAARALPTPAPGVIVQVMDEGAVLFDGTTEIYFGLNAVGAQVWSLLPPAHRTLGELCAALQALYPDAPAEVLLADIGALLDDLVANSLAVFDSAAVGQG